MPHESPWWTRPWTQRGVLALAVLVSAALAFWTYRRFGIAGSLALAAVWLAFHLAVRARQRRLTARLRASLARLSPRERDEALQALPQDLREEITRALAGERRE